MIAKNCELRDLTAALSIVNNKYTGNIRFKHGPDAANQAGNRWRFTLTVKDSAGPGGRRGMARIPWGAEDKTPARPGRRIAAACWHVHGHFFEALFHVKPEAVILSGGKLTITREAGNWQDRNIGSMIQPLMYSEACDCGSGRPLEYRRMGRDAGGALKTAEVRSVNQAHMTGECWFIQFRGRAACDTCPEKGRANCGGKSIVKTGKNSAGYAVPVQ